MSVLKPRNRLINFRLTEEEFEKLRDACRDQGARSISDFARSAVMTQAEGPVSTSAPARLEVSMQALDARVSRLIELLQSGQLRATGPEGDAKT